MMRNVVLSILVAATLLAWTPGSAAQGMAGDALYYETEVLSDNAADAGDPGLDLLKLYVGEKFLFDFDKKSEIGPAFLIRLEVMDLEQTESTGSRFIVHFTANGEAQEVYADVTLDGDGNIQVGESDFSPGLFAVYITRSSSSITWVVPLSWAGMEEPSELSGIWAAASTPAGDDSGQRLYHDVAPVANSGVPSLSATPPANQATHMLAGPFPFIQVNPLGPLTKASAEGAAVRFDFDVVPHPNVSSDLIEFRYQNVPPGWKVEPSKGTDQPPVGQLIDVNGGGNPIQFGTTFTAIGTPNIGDQFTATMLMYSNSGGVQRHDLTVRVDAHRVISPDFLFEMISPANLGTNSTLIFNVTQANGDALPTGLRVMVEFFQMNQVQGRTAATMNDAGQYEAAFVFPQSGEWLVDVYIASISPSPHSEFNVTVAAANAVPGPGLPLLFVFVVAAAILLRRRD